MLAVRSGRRSLKVPASTKAENAAWGDNSIKTDPSLDESAMKNFPDTQKCSANVGTLAYYMVEKL